MSRLFAVFIVLSLGTLSATEQLPTSFWGSPREVVEHFWEMGVRGELLTSQGWDTASGFFTKPNPIPQDKSFDVFSNYYGVQQTSIKGENAEIDMDFKNLGRIDSQLHYAPPPHSHAFKTALVFHVVLVPTYSSTKTFGPDGKTELGIEKKPTGNSAWEIEGPLDRPWTTVNTAIRYVLEMRSTVTDPIMKKNADETLAKLLTLH